jgi:hypothetical protein
LSFQSDPEFPRSIKNRSRSAQIRLFQSLFADYSELNLTYAADRPVAIESLAKALANALHTEVHCGIFECFLHRSLLWQRAQNTLTQISYPASKAPPSWSWMAYHGQIQYLPKEYGDIEWDNSVRLVEVKASDAATSPEDNGYVLEARVRRLRDCKMKPEGAKGVILDEEDNEVGQLYFDTQPGNVLPEVRCAIMGRGKTGAEDGNRLYYVLFVKCATQPGDRKFRRVGMGSIQKRFILFDGQDDTAQIL